MRRIGLCGGVVLSFWLSLAAVAMAVPDVNENGDARPKHGFDEVGVFVGYADTKIEQQGTYRIIPLSVQLGVSCDKYGLGFSDWVGRFIRLVSGKNVHPWGETTFIIEPFVNTVTSPNSNVEVGCQFLLRFGIPIAGRVIPYGFGGAGVMYASQHFREQSTQYNFTPQVGAGIAVMVTEKTAISCEYRYRHFSNASIRHPNSGVNMDMVYVGLTRKF